MINIDLKNKNWQWATLIVLSFLWGSSFILMKKGLESYSQYQVAAFRIFISFLAFLPIIAKNINKINRSNIKSLLIIAFIGTTIPAFMFTKAQTRIDSSIAGILNSLAPLFTLIIGAVFYKSKAKPINALGILIGLIGAMGLILKDAFNFELGDKNNFYGLYIIIAAICYGINANQVKYKIKDLSGLQITSLAFLFIGPPAGIYLLFSDFSNVIASDNYIQDLIYIAMLAVFASVIALSIFNTLIQYSSALFATSVSYIIPSFAILVGLLDGEVFHLSNIIWLVFIFGGVYLVNKQ
jgi:drug/metabolite transporter (DMT)-like permease